MAKNKPWYQSRAMIGGVLLVLGGVFAAVGSFLQGDLNAGSLIETVIPLIGTGLGIIGVRARL